MQKDPKQEIKNRENEVSATEQKIILPGRETTPEKREIVSDEVNLIREELEREVEMMKLDETLKKAAEVKAKAIGSLGDEEKIEHLFKIAREKGLSFAIKTAKDMNDPYILDTFHDILAKGGYYEKFLK